jgi:magnesium-transporting ATPase (P-type)
VEGSESSSDRAASPGQSRPDFRTESPWARALTSFDRGIARFTWLMIRFIAVMVPAVFLINGFTKGN